MSSPAAPLDARLIAVTEAAVRLRVGAVAGWLPLSLLSPADRAAIAAARIGDSLRVAVPAPHAAARGWSAAAPRDQGRLL